jgi:N-acetylneuraminic acid mutarotase
VATYENYLYAIAGQTATGVTGALERFDTAEGLWAPLAAKPLAAADVGAAVIGGQIFVPGGRLASGEISSVLEVYDPRSDQWERRSDLPGPVSAYAVAAFEGRLYLFGGWDGENYSATVYIYDPANDVWDIGTPMPTARGFGGAAVAGGRIYVVGGRTPHRMVSAPMERYDSPTSMTGRVAKK